MKLALRALIRPVYHSLYRLSLACYWLYLDTISSLRTVTGNPLPPARLRFRVSELSGEKAFLEVGKRTAQDLQTLLASEGCALQTPSSILDFGCGCGRTLRWLVAEHPAMSWFGSDVDPESIQWCNTHLPGVSASVNPPYPPSPFPGQAFDVIYAISVFTHLNEEYQRAWLMDLARILKPNGLLVLTFHSRNVWEHTDDSGTLNQGEFVFRTTKKLKGILPDWYQTAFQSQDLTTKLLNEFFQDVAYVPNAFGNQDAALARRPNAVSLIPQQA